MLSSPGFPVISLHSSMVLAGQELPENLCL